MMKRREFIAALGSAAACPLLGVLRIQRGFRLLRVRSYDGYQVIRHTAGIILHLFWEGILAMTALLGAQ
jgi:hypothetical protein